MERDRKRVNTLLIAVKRPMEDPDLMATLRYREDTLIITETGEEAIQAVRMHPEIDLILIAIDLLGMNGIDTIRGIRQLQQSIPIILLSTFLTVDTIRLALNIGCNEILQTPVKPDILEVIIKKYLEKQPSPAVEQGTPQVFQPTE